MQSEGGGLQELLARVVRENNLRRTHTPQIPTELSLASWLLHTWIPVLGMLFPLLFACPSFQSQLECLFFQEAFPDPPFSAGPDGPSMCLAS